MMSRGRGHRWCKRLSVSCSPLSGHAWRQEGAKSRVAHTAGSGLWLFWGPTDSEGSLLLGRALRAIARPGSPRSSTGWCRQRRSRAQCAVAIAGEGIYGNPWKGITPGSLQTAGPQTVPGHLQGTLWSQDNFNPFSKVLPVLVSEQVRGK